MHYKMGIQLNLKLVKQDICSMKHKLLNKKILLNKINEITNQKY